MTVDIRPTGDVELDLVRPADARQVACLAFRFANETGQHLYLGADPFPTVLLAEFGADLHVLSMQQPGVQSPDLGREGLRIALPRSEAQAGDLIERGWFPRVRWAVLIDDRPAAEIAASANHSAKLEAGTITLLMAEVGPRRPLCLIGYDACMLIGAGWGDVLDRLGAL